jgi:hypothetical protein
MPPPNIIVPTFIPPPTTPSIKKYVQIQWAHKVWRAQKVWRLTIPPMISCKKNKNFKKLVK